MLDGGSAALRPFRLYGETASTRLARTLRKFGSLALPNLNSPSLPPTITPPYDQTGQVPPHPPFTTIRLRVVSRSDESPTKHKFRNRVFLSDPLRSGRR